ncbi:CHAT domain-containing protein [Vararia minispora EC-137]|uniref:CHAT domain-containing protein n=1 Tax=Vararia minispora EC-137 TaxID=1314806 RepID=A0ACB8QK29_9AGAM|nr:CHAT domain-containing protein [Vararia minispora EC-137]
MPDEEEGKALHLHNLGDLFLQRFSSSKSDNDLSSALETLRRGVTIATGAHIHRGTALAGLARALILHDPTDLESAITLLREAVNLPFSLPQLRAVAFKGLGQALETRYQRQRRAADLDAAIDAHREAAELIPDADPNKVDFLRHLAVSIHTRYSSITHSIDDLNSVIAVSRRCVGLPRASSQPGALEDLGTALWQRFDMMGDLRDVDEAIETLEQANRLAPQTPSVLATLGISRLVRFERLGAPEDIQAAVAAQQQVADLVSDDDRSAKSGALHNLANALQMRFECAGALEDIDSAITAQRQAVELLKDEDPKKFMALHALGTAYHRRYDRLHEKTDMSASLACKRAASRAMPTGHPQEALVLNGLGAAWLLCYETDHESDALDNAVTALKRSVELTPDAHAHKGMRLHNLSRALSERFAVHGNEADISDAISAAQKVVASTPDFDPWRKAVALNHLGGYLMRRFEAYQEAADVDDAISVMQHSVDLVPADRIESATFPANLGKAYARRFELTQASADIDKAIKYLGAAQAPSRPVFTQFASTVMWARLCSKHRGPSEALAAYQVVLGQTRQLIWQGSKVYRRLEDIEKIREVFPEAVAVAISAGDLATAMEWAERGRCIIWSQMRLVLGAPIDALKGVAPKLAEELESVSLELGQSWNADQLRFSRYSSPDSEAAQIGKDQRRLAERHEELLKEVGKLPGFEHFSLPKGIAELRGAACDSPVVLINVDKSRCDALALVPDSEDIVHIPLTELSHAKAQKLLTSLVEILRQYGRIRSGSSSRAMRMASQRLSTAETLQNILGRLWTLVVEPIMDALEGKFRQPNGDKLPRITWCANGPLAFLPIHAAGIYDGAAPGRDRARVFDRVVSSYAPSITALLNAQRLEHISVPRVVAVSQSNTPEAAPLPGTVEEVRIVQKRLPNLTWLDGASATRKAVLESIKNHEWVHLACHGLQDSENPMKSAFMLDDGDLELLDIMREPLPHARLAVLSACQTATGDERYSDEAVHLAAGMLMAGFKSVVGTMWSINDDDAPVIAENLYEHLVNNMDSNSDHSAYALHNAVAKLREQIGENEFMRWLPFVHVGA